MDRKEESREFGGGWEQAGRAALERIHSLSRFGSRLGLERMKRLMELLGNPQDALPVIHVAGTNGKGSVSRYVYTVLRAAGYRAGLYTSPFLERFEERIEFDGTEISKEELAKCTDLVFDAMDRMLEEGMDSPTEFEAVTAIAFVYFQRMCPDAVVLEVGLGGTGDSTNVVAHPLVCAITSISFDHMEQLGNTLPEIASEKAGILKEGVPAVSGVKDPSAEAVILQTAGEKRCPLYEVWSDTPCAQAQGISESMEGSRFDARLKLGTEMYQYPGLKISMLGRHQIENALCALSVLKLAEARAAEIELPESAVYEGMREARQPGRLEVLERDPYLILDGAHNAAGVQALRKTVEAHLAGKRILLVIGMLADKEVERMTAEFVRITEHILVTEPDSARRLPAAELKAFVERTGCGCEQMDRWEDACCYIQKHKKEYDAVIAAGSLYLIGPMRSWLCGRGEAF